jgi:glycosyltransferase involved in cell wall biosynthesis
VKISACVITKNEEKNIVRCINSYKDIVDEIILVDTGSTDNTVEIAKSLGAKIYNYEWCNDFSAAKNFAISKAEGDWIIFLDADEFFAEGHCYNVKKYITLLHGDKKYDAICCRMANIEENDEIKNYVVQIRIFRNHPDIKYINSIHENLRKSSGQLKAFFVDKEDILIYHTGYSAGVGITKAERNLKLLLESKEKGYFPPHFNGYMSDCYFILKDWDNAIIYAQECINGGVSFFGYNIKPYINIIESMIQRGDDTELIIERLEEFIKEFSDNPTFYVFMGDALYKLKRYTEAFEFYKKADKLNGEYKGIDINLAVNKKYYICYKMGYICYLSNDYENAFTYFLESLKDKKHFYPAFIPLYMLVKYNTVQEKLGLFNSIYDLQNEEDVGYLTRVFAVLKDKNLLTYYESIWIKKYDKIDLTIAYTLFSNGLYDKAFAKFIEAYENGLVGDQLKSIVLAAYILHGYDYPSVYNIHGFPDEDRRFLKLIFSNKPVKIPEEFNSIYLDILKQIINVADDDSLNKYLAYAHYFQKPVWKDIIDIMIDNRMFASALGLCDFLYNTKKQGVDMQVEESELVFYMGVCYFKMEKYFEAIDMFHLAKDKGYKDNDLKEFMLWTDMYLQNM